ncbi:MAG: CBS domain-containing protein, partial [Deltaproteobacteria bacterium]|nr:CBS domain-containing protein [Deltaproteobacteria bacterium]
GYRHIPVLDEHGKPAHIVSVRDVLGYIAEHFPQEVLNVPSEPTRTSTPPDAPGS